jgi:hypothetical protein
MGAAREAGNDRCSICQPVGPPAGPVCMHKAWILALVAHHSAGSNTQAASMGNCTHANCTCDLTLDKARACTTTRLLPVHTHVHQGLHGPQLAQPSGMQRKQHRTFTKKRHQAKQIPTAPSQGDAAITSVPVLTRPPNHCKPRARSAPRNMVVGVHTASLSRTVV